MNELLQVRYAPDGSIWSSFSKRMCPGFFYLNCDWNIAEHGTAVFQLAAAHITRAATRGCLPQRAVVSGRGIGPVRLGHSLKTLEAHYGVLRRSRGNIRLCVRGGGRFLVRGTNGKITFIASNAPRHRTRRVAPGKRVSGATKGFRRAAPHLYVTKRAEPGRIAYRVTKGRTTYLAVLGNRDSEKAHTLIKTLRRARLL
jgi:hypothetical protein